MNPSTALATVLVDELVRLGVGEAVLSPGSRSAPLALALRRADEAGSLRLHVRIDERSAGFLAVGLAKAVDAPVAVLTTSGTAAANLHPAVLEAAHAGVPLVLLTADRPPELRGVGASQTIDQIKLFGDVVRLFCEVGAPEWRDGQNAYWRSLACRAVTASRGTLDARPGPVHLNVALREPLLPDDEPWPESLDGRPDGGPWTAVDDLPARSAPPDDLPDRTLVVVGDAHPAVTKQAALLAEARCWPVLSEPSGNARSGPGAVTTADLLLAAPLPVDLAPDRVLVVGRPTLTRPVRALLSGTAFDVVAAGSGWADPVAAAGRVLPGVPELGRRARDRSWLEGWSRAEALARAAVDAVLDAGPLSEQLVARELVATVPASGLVFAGSSLPVRHLFLARAREEVTVLANRGVAGIDGSVSTAIGAALTWQAGGGGPAYALLGDLTFLHDANGLALGPREPRPDLTIVVLNNDGGGIFSTLEQDGDDPEGFERVFGTPHGVDLRSLCGSTRTPYQLIDSVAELSRALASVPGLRVLEVRTDRTATRDLQHRLGAAVVAAVASVS